MASGQISAYLKTSLTKTLLIFFKKLKSSKMCVRSLRSLRNSLYIILKNGRQNGISASVTVNVPHWVTVALITFFGMSALAGYISIEPGENIKNIEYKRS